MTPFARNTTMLTLLPRKIAKTNSGFTLVEILVVIGITAILFFLLLGPLVNSFRLTQRAQMLAAAQDDARKTLEILTRELGSAAYIFDNNSHPFTQATPASTQYSQDQFSNFLDIDVPIDPTSAGYDPTKPTLPAHAYNAKLDFVLPRHNATSGIVDPTTGEPITVQNGSAVSTGLTFPLAPGTTMIRYFVGRRDPSKVYATHGEGSLLARNGNNTYIFYRAQFQPYTLPDPKTGKPAPNADGTTINEALLTPKLDSNGKAINTPEFDDPDFFRIVTDNDINWLDQNHGTYGTTGQTVAHNTRVANWFQIAKPVISSPNTDLILLPHNRDNSVAYGTVTDFPTLAASGEVQDSVTGTLSPVVNTSVTFKFASVSADASAATNADYASTGYGSNSDANNGLPYVPSVYTAKDQSWAYPYHLSLYQYVNSSSAGAGPNLLYDVRVAQPGDMVPTASVVPTNMPPQVGDVLEMYNNNGTFEPVYDVTNGASLSSSYPYVPIVVNPDTATINFDQPALPDPTQPTLRFWNIKASLFEDDTAAYPNPALPAEVGPGVLDLTNTTIFANSPLATVANAHVVPGSMRVFGPDSTPGPGYGLTVPYAETFAGSSTFGPNQFIVDYGRNTLTLYIDPGTNKLPQAPGSPDPTSPVKITYDYQSNMASTDPSGNAFAPLSAGDPFSPLLVKVDYKTRDLLDINLGVRIYDPNNVGPASVVTVHNQVRIGNSNR